MQPLPLLAASEDDDDEEWDVATATDSDDDGTGSSSEEDVEPGYFDKAYDEVMCTELSSHQAMRVSDPFSASAQPPNDGQILPPTSQLIMSCWCIDERKNWPHFLHLFEYPPKKTGLWWRECKGHSLVSHLKSQCLQGLAIVSIR
jgi:hypothetical protein